MALVARQIVGDDLSIESVQIPRNPRRQPVVLSGLLNRPSEDVFGRWLTEFNRRGYTPLLRRDEASALRGGTQQAVVLEVLAGAVQRTPSRAWINLVLFVLTVISTLFVGALYGDLDVDPTLPPNVLLWQILTTPSLLLRRWTYLPPR